MAYPTLTLDYDKVKTEIKNEIGKATAKRKMVLTFEEKLAGLRAQMTPEIRASLQEDAVKAGERRIGGGPRWGPEYKHPMSL